jgi:hypothetical protein
MSKMVESRRQDIVPGMPFTKCLDQNWLGRNEWVVLSLRNGSRGNSLASRVREADHISQRAEVIQFAQPGADDHFGIPSITLHV